MACCGRKLRQAGLNRPMEMDVYEDGAVRRRAREGAELFHAEVELAADGTFEAEPGNKQSKHKCKYLGL